MAKEVQDLLSASVPDEYTPHPVFDRPHDYPARNTSNPYTREALKKAHSAVAFKKTAGRQWDRTIAGRHFDAPEAEALALEEPKTPPMSRVIFIADEHTTPEKSAAMKAALHKKREAERKGKRTRRKLVMSDKAVDELKPTVPTEQTFLAAPIVLVRTVEADGVIKMREFTCKAICDFKKQDKLREAFVTAAVNGRSVKGKAKRKKRRKHHKEIKNPPTPQKLIQLILERSYTSAPKIRKSISHFFGDSYDYALIKLGFTRQFVDWIKPKYEELVKRLKLNNLKGCDVEELLNHHEVKAYLERKEIDSKTLNDHDKFMIVLHLVQSREVLHMVANSIRHKDEDFMNGSRLENSVMIPAESFIRELNKEFGLILKTRADYQMDLEPGREGHVSYLPKGAIVLECQIIGSLTSFEFRIPVSDILQPVLPAGFAHEFIKVVTEPYIQEYKEGGRRVDAASPVRADMDEQPDDDIAGKGEEVTDSGVSSSGSEDALIDSPSPMRP